MLLVSIVTIFDVACTSQSNNTRTTNSEPIIKTEPAKPMSDKGEADGKAFTTKTLPTLKMHLEITKGLAGKMGVKTKM